MYSLGMETELKRGREGHSRGGIWSEGGPVGGWDGQRVGTREDEGEMIMKYQ